MFPRRSKVLTAEDWAKSTRRMKPILDPVFGQQPEGDFEEPCTMPSTAKPEAGLRPSSVPA
jgi:hypothetical protein